MVHTVYFGQLIFGIINTTAATIGQILRLKCTKFYYGWGSAPDPAGGAYSTPTLAGFKGPIFKRKEGRGGDRSKRKGGNVDFNRLLLSNLTTVCD